MSFRQKTCIYLQCWTVQEALSTRITATGITPVQHSRSQWDCSTQTIDIHSSALMSCWFKYPTAEVWVTPGGGASHCWWGNVPLGSRGWSVQTHKHLGGPRFPSNTILKTTFSAWVINFYLTVHEGRVLNGHHVTQAWGVCRVWASWGDRNNRPTWSISLERLIKRSVEIYRIKINTLKLNVEVWRNCSIYFFVYFCLFFIHIALCVSIFSLFIYINSHEAIGIKSENAYIINNTHAYTYISTFIISFNYLYISWIIPLYFHIHSPILGLISFYML